MISIRNLTAAAVADGGGHVPILRGIDLEVQSGQVHAIMGPNGSGKSTLARVVGGHPSYVVTAGSMVYEINMRKRDMLAMDPDVRAKNGVFIGFQYPIEIPGVSNATFLRAAYNEIAKSQGLPELDPIDFEKLLLEKLRLLSMAEDFAFRDVNVDFSGGEKKRNEIIQLALLAPRLAILDETDSGLDIDSLRSVAEGIKKLRHSENSFILITHYQRMLNFITPDVVHVMYDGRIVRSGSSELAVQIEERGYEWIIEGLAN